MACLMIDAHVHLWRELNGRIGQLPVKSLGGGRATFKGEVRQIMPPYMVNGENTAEMLLSNMDYAGVAGAVITQEFIDGDQNEYLLQVKDRFPGRVKICALAEFREPGFRAQVEAALDRGFDGIKVPAQWFVQLPERLYLNSDEMLQTFKRMEGRGAFLSIDLAEGDCQVEEMKEVIRACPDLRIAVGHFGMTNRSGWEQQILLAEYENVYIESGGITWLFHKEFYPYRGAVEAVRRAADMVGMHKLMWGSDYPRTMTAITYKMSFDFFLKTDRLSEQEKLQFLGGNAKEFYGFASLEAREGIRNMVED